jgi:hypothetical protein
VDYFVVYPRQAEMPNAFNTDLAAAGRFLAGSPIWQSSRANVYVTDQFEENRASVAFFLYSGLTPAQRLNWLDASNVGGFFPEEQLIPLPVAPSVYVLGGDDRVARDVLGPAIRQSTALNDQGGRPVEAILTNPWPAEVAPGPSGLGWQPVQAQFGNVLGLESAAVEVPATNGAGMAQGVDAPGPAVATAVLRWKVLARPAYQPSIFVHLEDSAGHFLAQHDQEVAFATSSWQVGQELVSLHPIPLPPGTPPGQYRLTAGVYDKSTGTRETIVQQQRAVATLVAATFALSAPVAGVVAVDHQVGATVAPGLTLVGDSLTSSNVEAGSKLAVTLVWRADGPSRPAEQVTVALRGFDGNVVGRWAGPVGSAAFPVSQWPAGSVIRQIVDVPVQATASGTAGLVVSLSPTDAAAGGGLGNPSQSLAQIAITASSHSFVAPGLGRPLNASFAAVGTLVGLDLPPVGVKAGQDVTITLFWQASAATDLPYTVFVHVLNQDGKVVAQRDEPPDHGTRPTTGWVPGEYVTDPHTITIDPSTPAGTYRLEIGLYDQTSGHRVAVGAGDDHVIVEPLVIGG